MKVRIKGRQRVARLAILAALAVVFVGYDASQCPGQAAGFAQSRSESAGTASSGARSFISSINPFKQSEPETPLVSSSTISQPVASSRTYGTPVALPKPKASTSKSTTRSTTKKSASKSSSISAPKSSVSSRQSSSSGVASLLLDELEEENNEVKTSVGQANGRKVERRSLRNARTPDSMELLSDEELLDEDETEEYESSETAGLVAMSVEEEENAEPVKKSSKRRVDVISTDDEEEETLVEEEVEEEIEEVETVVDASDDEDAPMEHEVDASNKPTSKVKVRNAQKQESVSSLESLDSHFDNRRNGDEPREKKIASQTIVVEGDAEELDENVGLTSSRAPIVEVSTLGPKRLIVGQESTYKISVRNVGEEPARQLVVTTELPESVSTQKMDAQVGTASVERYNERSNAKHCVWKVGTLKPGEEVALSIDLIPMKRVAFELVSNFEFERASARADVEVQEPILEALIEGRDSIEWGVEDKFRLRLRNIGNGDAENVDLFVSTGENKASQRIGILKAGEEKTIEMSVKTVADDFFSIDVEAVGAYGVKAVASKKIASLRGKLDIEVETPDLQFVEGEFEAKVHVRNLGDATLQNVDVVAQIPEGVDLVFCSSQARRNPEKRRVYWSAPFLRPNEETIFSVMCRVNEAGAAKFEVVGVDQTGVVAQADSTVNVESIAVLAMRVKAPKEPVAVGKKCVYELIVENNGTRDARDVNSGVFLGSGMKPVAIEGDQGVVYENDSKVLFKKIDCLKAGETVVFRIQAQALAPGNQKIQAMLQSASEDVSLLSEETTYCYSRAKDVPTRGRTDVFDSPTVTAEKDLGGVMRK